MANVKSLIVTGNANVNGTILANGFKRPGGTSSQFLKADGSADSTTYLKNTDSSIYTGAEKTKLAGIAAGALVNVQPNWNATSGATAILNKPDVIKNNEILLRNSSFADGRRLYVSKLDNILYAANHRYSYYHKLYTDTTYKIDCGIDLFDCNYESHWSGNASNIELDVPRKYSLNKGVIYIGHTTEGALSATTSGCMFTYGSGYIIISFYYNSKPTTLKVEAFVSNHSANTNNLGSGWIDYTADTRYVTNKGTSCVVIQTHGSVTQVKAIRITYDIVKGGGDNNTYSIPSEVEYYAVRANAELEAVVTKHAIPQELYGNVTAPKFIKRGGTSTLLLKANGDVMNVSDIALTINNNSSTYLDINNGQLAIKTVPLGEAAGMTKKYTLADGSDPVDEQDATHIYVQWIKGTGTGVVDGLASAADVAYELVSDEEVIADALNAFETRIASLESTIQQMQQYINQLLSQQ